MNGPTSVMNLAVLAHCASTVITETKDETRKGSIKAMASLASIKDATDKRAENALRMRENRATMKRELTNRVIDVVCGLAPDETRSDVERYTQFARLDWTRLGHDKDAIERAAIAVVSGLKRYQTKPTTEGETTSPGAFFDKVKHAVTRSGHELIEQLTGQSANRSSTTGKVRVPDYLGSREVDAANEYRELWNAGATCKASPFFRVVEHAWPEAYQTTLDTTSTMVPATSTENRAGIRSIKDTGLILSRAWDSWYYARHNTSREGIGSGIKPTYAEYRLVKGMPVEPPAKISIASAMKLQATILPSITTPPVPRTYKAERPDQLKRTPEGYPYMVWRPSLQAIPESMPVLRTEGNRPYMAYPRIVSYAPVSCPDGAKRDIGVTHTVVLKSTGMVLARHGRNSAYDVRPMVTPRTYEPRFNGPVTPPLAR